MFLSLLAFDAATVAATYAKTGSIPVTSSGLTGEIRFDVKGFRTGDFIYVGISALSARNSNAMLLQNSSWILEDSVHMRRGGEADYKVVQSQVATSSVLQRNELLEFAKRGEAKGHGTCNESSLELSAHDPFNQLIYR